MDPLTNLKTLLVAFSALAYGEEAVAALLRLFGLSLPIVAVADFDFGGLHRYTK